MQTLPDQIPPVPTPTISHQYSKTPHQTLPQAAKMETAGEETRPSNKLTDSAMPQEIISFLRLKNHLYEDPYSSQFLHFSSL